MPGFGCNKGAAASANAWIASANGGVAKVEIDCD
jgi:hypothetical protein